MKEYKFTAIRHNFIRFCQKNKVNPEDLLCYCEGRIDNFPRWYCDYINYYRQEIRSRIKYGVVNKIKLEDVW